MKVILDTAAVIWFFGDDPQLPTRVKTLLEMDTCEPYVSAVSAYEIEWKRSLGRPLPELPLDLEQSLSAFGFASLPITMGHMVAAGRLPIEHRDPWDRVLAAQSQAEGAPILSPDPYFSKVGCSVIW